MTSPARAYPLTRPSVRQYIFSPQLFLRPSIRLKSSLYVLSITIIILVILALNAATSTSNPPEVDVNTVPSHDSPADSGEGKDVAKGKDAHLVDQEIQRSFEEPDFSLLASAQPHEIGCDIPLDGKDKGVFMFLGIFSAADKRERRDLYRQVVIPDFPSDQFTIKFILGTPPFPENPIGQEAIARTVLMNKVEAEMREFGDMVMLPMIDNIDLGKTHEYFKWVAKEYSGPGRVKGRPRFVMKADDDTILVMPNLISGFKDLNCADNVYWGTSAGRSHYFGDYFRGLAYAMSWPLVSWIGNAEMPPAHIIKIEDARTGQWLRHLDPVTDPVKRIDMGWTMGDWNQLDVGVETVALHWLKLDDWVKEQHARLHTIWADDNRPYDIENGVHPKISVQKGRQTPERAQKEHQRQKDLGWDVGGNLD
ncbi:hypothetical protein I302_106539 [Kwoniella bestiolae CBS 10118]|uniref:Hexosyltransferase n=1 Tax=Kwoniella bestiolae CBS 10118 TaxID=1296100 RepID=A0A1B9G155_9TREE|nr:hypothetical protein I302_06202 [Kwoniella bestiolae CBS 10118]OCF24741.1 hypothetical protein I302_06202 [Kwoniella bestiolae CBS 10118]